VERKLYVSGVKHWREYCNYCEKFRDPRTNEFSVSRQASAQFFGNLYRRDKPMPKAKVPKEPKEKKPRVQEYPKEHIVDPSLVIRHGLFIVTFE
jgi:hypothetical protein